MIKPADVSLILETRSRAEFAESMGASAVLIRIPDGENAELEQALLASLASPGTALAATLSFHTVARVTPRLAGRVGTADSFDPRVIRQKLHEWLASSAVTVVVPLRKRARSGKDFTQRISVGRALNNDVVLRDESVSKFHAWLEKDEEGNFYVSDAGSRNGTWLNGLRLPPRESTPVPWGGELRFAAIAAKISTTELLWDAVRLSER